MTTESAAPAASEAPEEAPEPKVGIARRVLQGDLAELRVILVLAVIWARTSARTPSPATAAPTPSRYSPCRPRSRSARPWPSP
jgi:hypothetical protein